jgi:CRP/FNR family transcriptional regulator
MADHTPLAEFSFFEKLTAEEQRELVHVARPASLSAGAPFYAEGDELPYFALVLSGRLRVYKTSESGREMTLYHVEKGEPCLINMLCVFLGRPAMVSADAETDVEALLVSGETFRGLVKRSDGMRAFVFESMAERVVSVMTLTEEIVFRKTDERLADYLGRRFRSAEEIVVTHEEIAADLGTAREVVSRLLKELERAGALTLGRGRIRLRNAAALRVGGVPAVP